MVLTLLVAASARAEEGMWTLDNLPRAHLKARYGFEPDQAFLDHVRLSSARMMRGGSGAFVSPYGLIATNHHVAFEELENLSSKGRNLVEHGFLARTLEEELPCPGSEVNVLQAMRDVTAEVRKAVSPGMSPADAQAARTAAIARLEREGLEATGLHSEVVSLYRGGEYWLYQYKKYTDIRLVFAPERSLAAFGGDPDNFTYPRYCLDVAFLRVWENGAPLKTDHFLRWSPRGPKESELIFVSGHPGATERLLTVEQLRERRDRMKPASIEKLKKLMAALEAYAARGVEERRQAEGALMAFSNVLKAYKGELQTLERPENFERLAAQEADLRRKIRDDTNKSREIGDPWSEIDQVLSREASRRRQIEERSELLVRGGPTVLKWALGLAGYALETSRPDDERLPGFHEAELPRLRYMLLAEVPVYRGLEAAWLEAVLRLVRDALPAGDPIGDSIRALGDLSQAAARFVRETRLLDVAARRALLEAGRPALERSTDPLVALAREIAPIMAADQRWLDRTVRSIVTPAEERIAAARFAVFGKKVYPDATFTLRLTFGPIQGYEMNGTVAPYKTTLWGLFERAAAFDGRVPWKLPERVRSQVLRLSTPVNFVADCDIIGGNSGSPVIDRAGALIGVVFDGNIESLANRYLYDAARSRAVAVSSAWVLEALEQIYGAGDLAGELRQRGSHPKK